MVACYSSIKFLASPIWKSGSAGHTFSSLSSREFIDPGVQAIIFAISFIDKVWHWGSFAKSQAEGIVDWEEE